MTIQNHTFAIAHTVGTPRVSRFELMVPNKITGLAFVSRTTTSLTFSWTADAIAETYNVYMGGTSTPYVTEITNTTTTIYNLSSNSSYQIYVSGVNAAGEGTLSNPITMTTSATTIGNRDRKLHPFPEDDPFNMPLGVNAYYAPSNDPASLEFTDHGMAITINNGWSHPIFFPTTSDPIHTFIHARWGECDWLSCKAESYIPEEHESCCISERLPEGADTYSNERNLDGYWDDHLHIIIDNELVELFRYNQTEVTGTYNKHARRLVRNQLDHYCFSRYKFSNPLANTAGCRAWGGSSIAGLIRKHEIDTDNPYIPHALAIAGGRLQMGSTNDGDSSSPLYSAYNMFPANAIDSGGYTHYGGSANFRMGMRLALDPSIATNTWIESAPNKYAKALAYAMRDYGCIVTDTAGSTNLFYGEEGISYTVELALREGMNFMRSAVRRVGGAGPLHNPEESDWQAWADTKQGWGGGAPRVPYPAPLENL